MINQDVAPSPSQARGVLENALARAETKARDVAVDINLIKTKLLSEAQLAMLDAAASQLNTFAQAVRADREQLKGI